MYTRLTVRGRVASRALWLTSLWGGITIFSLWILVALGAAVNRTVQNALAHPLPPPPRMYPAMVYITPSNRPPANWFSPNGSSPLRSQVAVKSAAGEPKPYVSGQPPPESPIVNITKPATTRPSIGLVHNRTSWFAPNQKTQQTGFVYPTGFNSAYHGTSHE